jgi:hypothetical protein
MNLRDSVIKWWRNGPVVVGRYNFDYDDLDHDNEGLPPHPPGGISHKTIEREPIVAGDNDITRDVLEELAAMIVFHTMVARDGVPVATADKALRAVDEFRKVASWNTPKDAPPSVWHRPRVFGLN